jgi:hypothetical protein
VDPHQGPAPAERHDTLVLPHDSLSLQHDTVALPRPAGAAATGQAHAGPAPTAASSAAAPTAPGAAGSVPVSGWLATQQWRGMASQHAGTWSQVPPFIPAAQPPRIVMRNNAAVVGATLGSVSLFLALLPLIGIVAWVLAPIAVVSSGVGLVVGMHRRVGRVGALWGLLTGGLALVVCLAWAALLLAL